VFKEQGPLEGTIEHKKLQESAGFSYQTLIGELLYAYNVCCLDIGFAISTMSKFSTNPTSLHYTYLKGIALYLRRTKKWGLRYKKSTDKPDTTLPSHHDDDNPIPLPDSLPDFPQLPTDTTITCLVDGAYGNDLSCRKSTTGFAIMLANAAIVYKSKSQTQTALSSTEAEFYAAVSAAKIILYL